MTSNVISLTPSRVTRILAVVAILLIVVSTAGQLTKYLTGHNWVFGLVPLFYLDAELNVPTLFSALLLLFASILLALIAVLKARASVPFTAHWSLLAAGFLLMAADEAVGLHELLMARMIVWFGEDIKTTFFFPWVIPASILVLVLALFFLSFLKHLPATTRRGFLIAAGLFLGGSIGLELVGGWYASWVEFGGLTYSLITTCEESMEMAGVIVFIRELLVYLGENYNEVCLKFDEAPRQV